MTHIGRFELKTFTAGLVFGKKAVCGGNKKHFNKAKLMKEQCPEWDKLKTLVEMVITFAFN